MELKAPSLRCQKRLDALTAEYETKIADLNAAHATEIASLKTLHAEEIEELNSSHAAEIAALKAAHQAEIDTLITYYTAQIDAMIAAHEAEIAAIKAEAARQHEEDLLRIQELEQYIWDLEHPQPPEEKTLWGANVGGWSQTKREPAATAFARIKEGFGAINVIRYWPGRFFQWSEVPAFYGMTPIAPDMGSDVQGILRGDYDDDMYRICEEADRLTLGTVAHEPENNGVAISDWQEAQMRLAFIKADVGNPLMKIGPLLMGASYHATRYQNTWPGHTNYPASVWLDFDLTNCDFIGGDFYQWGKGDADADHAETVIGPIRDMALSKGKPIVIGELGARRRLTCSDEVRARYIVETAEIVDANPGLFAAIMYYEVDRGDPEKVPWNLLETDSPAAVAAYRALCLL